MGTIRVANQPKARTGMMSLSVQEKKAKAEVSEVTNIEELAYLKAMVIRRIGLSCKALY
jgi:hypothetical protein